MDIQKLREEFEKLPEISEKLKRAQWAEKYQQYLANDIYCKEKDLHFLDGAWYAFQEQQKIVGELIKSNIAISEQLDRFKKELLK